MNHSYTINGATMYIGADESVQGEVITQILESSGNLYKVNKTSNRIVMENCRAYSSNYSHRKEITKHLTRIISKQPIMIDFIGSYIYFPMYSDRNHINHWFNIKYVEDYIKVGDLTRVTFTNGETIDIDVSYYTFERQYMCALKLYYKASQKREKIVEQEKNNGPDMRSVEADLKFLEEYRRQQYINFMQNVDLMK